MLDTFLILYLICSRIMVAAFLALLKAFVANYLSFSNEPIG